MAVPLFASTLEPYHDRLAEALERVARSGRYILGPEVAAFEREFADYLGLRHCVGVANGTDALTIALRALGVGDGDEVVVPSFTFYATVEAAVAAGTARARRGAPAYGQHGLGERLQPPRAVEGADHAYRLYVPRD